MKPSGPPSSLRWPVASKSFGSTAPPSGAVNGSSAPSLASLRRRPRAETKSKQSIEEETEGGDNGKRRAMMLRAVALPSRAGVIVNLSNALRTLVALERQAFNLGDSLDGNDRAADAPVSDDRRKAALALIAGQDHENGEWAPLAWQV